MTLSPFVPDGDSPADDDHLSADEPFGRTRTSLPKNESCKYGCGEAALVGIRADQSPESLLEVIGSYGRALNTLLTSATYIPPRLRQLLSNSHYTTGQRREFRSFPSRRRFRMGIARNTRYLVIASKKF